MNYNGQERRHHEEDRRENEWHTSRTTSYSIIFLLLTNIGATIWWASELNADVKSLKNVPDQVSNLEQRVITLEVQNSQAVKVLEEFKRVLEKLDQTIENVAKEQSRRTPVIKKAEDEFFNYRGNNGGSR